MAPLRSASTAALELPAVDGRKRGAVQQTAAAAALPPQRAGRRLDASASAPSLTLAALSGQVHEMGETIERAVAKLTERPGFGPLLRMRDEEHSASILKVVRPDHRVRRGPPPPRLLTQPPLKRGQLKSLQQRSTVLTDVADELGAARFGEALLDDDDDNDGAGGADDGDGASAFDEQENGHQLLRRPASMGGIALMGQRRPSVSAFAHDAHEQPLPMPPATAEAALMATPQQRQQQLLQQQRRRQLARMSDSERALVASRGGGASTSSLHAARAAAARSQAQFETKLDRSMEEYRLSRQRTAATVAIQSNWRGRSSRRLVSEELHARRDEFRHFLKAWRTLTVAHLHERGAILVKAFFGWLREQRLALGALRLLGRLMTRAVGTSAAFAYWRLVLDKRKRRPPPPDTPSVADALARCMLLVLARRILHAWRRHIKRMFAAREQAARKIRSAAKPMHLWPSECCSSPS